MRIISLFIIFGLISYRCFAQNEASTIYWGTCILDFRVSPFQVLSTTAVNSRESATSICDENGNLLFYSNGGKSPSAPNVPAGAWGANGQYLQNGQDLLQLGCNSTQQGAVILPDPAGISPTSKNYYLLTKDCVEAAVMGAQSNNTGFSYGIIDMLANGGSGSVVSQNNVVVPYIGSAGHSTDWEPITVVLDTDGEQKSGTAGYWVYSYQGDSLYKIHFGVNGFESFQKLFPERGNIVVAPDRNHLIIKGQRLYDLDAPSGNLQLVHTFSSPTNATFSPDGKKLYRMETDKLMQYDLEQTNWENNPYEVASFSSTQNRLITLVPSGSIFVFESSTAVDAQIVCPNNTGVDCGFDPTDLSLQGGAISGFLNIPAHYLYRTNSTCHLGLEEAVYEKIVLAPNPSVGHITIYLNGISLSQATLRITDLTGRTIRTEELSGLMEKDHAEIHAEDLPNGEYFLEITPKDKEPAVKRLVIQH